MRMSDRIRVLDAARGFAVLGLLYAHFPSTGGSALVFDDPALLGWSPLSAGLWAVEAVWVDGVMHNAACSPPCSGPPWRSCWPSRAGWR
jgi:uncharacterized protein